METLIQDIKTGDVLSASGTTVPFISHVGIVVIDNEGIFVYHVTPDLLNGFGGSLVRENLFAWLTPRRNIKVRSTGISADRIKQVFEELKYNKYNVFTFNCEHFVKYATEGMTGSKQVRAGVLGIVFAVLKIMKVV